MDLKALGFDIAEGVNDPYLPGDCGIFVTRVDKGSIADGRLRYFFRYIEFFLDNCILLFHHHGYFCLNQLCVSFFPQSE